MCHIHFYAMVNIISGVQLKLTYWNSNNTGVWQKHFDQTFGTLPMNYKIHVDGVSLWEKL